jgi:hypothetical protein
VEDDQGADPAGERERDETGEPSARPSLRPSFRPPSSPPPTGRAANWRLVFAAVWVFVQVSLVVTADRRADGAFGFRMFSESSSLRIALFREVIGEGGRVARVHVDEGVWSAHAADGTVHRLTWYDRVPSPYWIFDQEMHASYGAATQLGRLQAALDDVAAHTPNDSETSRLVLQVAVRRNGREPIVHQLTSRPRPLPSSPAPPSVPASLPPATP